MSIVRALIASSLLLMVGTSSVAAKERPQLLGAETEGLTQLLAQTSPEPGSRNGGRGQERLMQDLGLSQDQMQQIQTIRQRYQAQMESRRQAARQAHQELRTLMAGDASVTDIRRKHDQVQQLQQELAQLRFESMLEMRGVLTVEQRQRMNERMQQRGPGRNGGQGQGMRRNGGGTGAR